MASATTIVLITGANSGIGYSTAEALLRAPTDSTKYHVILACRSVDKGNTALATLQSQQLSSLSTASVVQLDVTNPSSIDAAVNKVTNTHGRLDVLINNAGFLDRSPELSTQLRNTLEPNVHGPAVVTQAFLPSLLQSPIAKIINISSSIGSIALRVATSSQRPGGWPYRMSKAALNMLTACLHADHGDKIKVWAFDPGLVVTNFADGADSIRKRGGGDPAVAGQSIVDIIEGKRDDVVGKLIHKDGVHPW